MVLAGCSPMPLNTNNSLINDFKEQSKSTDSGAGDRNAVLKDDSYECYYSEPLDVYYYAIVNHGNDQFYNCMWDVNWFKGAISSNNNLALHEYGYCFIDINDDGINELIIGDVSSDISSDALVYLICTLHDKAPYQVLSGDKFQRYYICDGNIIAHEDTGTYGDSSKYRLSFEDFSLDLVESVRSRYENGKGEYWVLTDASGNETLITEADAKSTMTAYSECRVKLSLIPFSDYSPNMPEEFYADAQYIPVGKEYSTWQEGYLSYLSDLKYHGNDRFTCALIYVDDDNIPEMVINSGNQINGCYILSYYNGMVTAFQTERLNFTYIEKGGLIRNTDGTLGFNFDYVHQLKDGRWKCIFYGTIYRNYDVADSLSKDAFLYYIDKENVSSNRYSSGLNEVYDTSKEQALHQYIKLDEMIGCLMSV